MTPEKSKILGRRSALGSAIAIFLAFEFIYLISETKGDFANGVLFFIDRQMNVFIILSFLIFFLSFILLGQRAGRKILILNANPFKIAFLYGIVTTVLMLAYYSIPVFHALNVRTGIYSESDQNQLLHSFLLFSIALSVFFIIGWLITTHRIHKASDKIDNV